MRLQLARPDNDLVSAQTFNELFTMHGTTMVFLAIMPLSAAFFNFMIPLHDRRARRRLPPAQRALLLDLPRRRPLPELELPVRGRARRRLVRLRQPHHPPVLPGRQHRLLDARPADPRHRVHARRLQLHRHHRQHARPRHDPHAHAGVHLDVAGRPVPDRARLPRHHGRPHPPHVRPVLRHALLRARRRRAIRSSGSTSSGSSATPRSTSSSCPPWASSPRCCPPSRASRSSARPSSSTPAS